MTDRCAARATFNNAPCTVLRAGNSKKGQKGARGLDGDYFAGVLFLFWRRGLPNRESSAF